MSLTELKKRLGTSFLFNQYLAATQRNIATLTLEWCNILVSGKEQTSMNIVSHNPKCSELI